MRDIVGWFTPQSGNGAVVVTAGSGPGGSGGGGDNTNTGGGGGGGGASGATVYISAKPSLDRRQHPPVLSRLKAAMAVMVDRLRPVTPGAAVVAAEPVVVGLLLNIPHGQVPP